jgi:hypothetical protein
LQDPDHDVQGSARPTAEDLVHGRNNDSTGDDDDTCVCWKDVISRLERLPDGEGRRRRPIEVG